MRGMEISQDFGSHIVKYRILFIPPINIRLYRQIDQRENYPSDKFVGFF